MPARLHKPDQDPTSQTRKLGEDIGSRREIIQERGNATACQELGEDQPAGEQEPTRGPVPYLTELSGHFDADLSGVEAWFGAGELLSDLDAGAAAIGDAIYFRDGNPDKEQVAHELAHVAQRRKNGGGGSGVSAPTDDAEREAEQAAAAAVRGESTELSASLSAEVHRDEDKPAAGTSEPKAKIPLPPKGADPHAAGIAAADAEVKVQTSELTARQAELGRLHTEQVQNEMDIWDHEKMEAQTRVKQEARGRLESERHVAGEHLERATAKAAAAEAHTTRVEGKLEAARAKWTGAKKDWERMAPIEKELAEKRAELKRLQEARAEAAKQSNTKTRAVVDEVRKPAAPAPATNVEAPKADAPKGVMQSLGDKGRKGALVRITRAIIEGHAAGTGVQGPAVDPVAEVAKPPPGGAQVNAQRERGSRARQPEVRPGNSRPLPPNEAALQKRIDELVVQRRAIDPLRQTRQAAVGAEARLKELEARVAELRAAQSKATTAMVDATATVTDLDERIAQKTADIDAHKGRVEAGRAQADALRARNGVLPDELAAKNAEVKQAEKALADAKEAREAARARALAAKAQVAEAGKAKAELETTAKDAEGTHKAAAAEEAKAPKAADPNMSPDPAKAPTPAAEPVKAPVASQPVIEPTRVPPKTPPSDLPMHAPQVDAPPRVPTVDGPKTKGAGPMKFLGPMLDAYTAYQHYDNYGKPGNDALDDDYQAVVGGTSSVLGVVGGGPGAALSGAVGLNQAGDAYRKRKGQGTASDVAAEHGDNARRWTEDATGSPVLGHIVGGTTTLGSSFIEGTKNFGLGAYETVRSLFNMFERPRLPSTPAKALPPHTTCGSHRSKTRQEPMVTFPETGPGSTEDMIRRMGLTPQPGGNQGATPGVHAPRPGEIDAMPEAGLSSEDKELLLRHLMQM